MPKLSLVWVRVCLFFLLYGFFPILDPLAPLAQGPVGPVGTGPKDPMGPVGAPHTPPAYLEEAKASSNSSVFDYSIGSRSVPRLGSGIQIWNPNIGFNIGFRGALDLEAEVWGRSPQGKILGAFLQARDAPSLPVPLVHSNGNPNFKRPFAFLQQRPV